MISSLKIKIPKKPGFGRKKSFEDMVTTLGPTAQATLLLLLLLQKLKQFAFVFREE
jgi:hypothetical protein